LFLVSCFGLTSVFSVCAVSPVHVAQIAMQPRASGVDPMRRKDRKRKEMKSADERGCLSSVVRSELDGLVFDIEIARANKRAVCSYCKLKATVEQSA